MGNSDTTPTWGGDAFEVAPSADSIPYALIDELLRLRQLNVAILRRMGDGYVGVDIAHDVERQGRIIGNCLEIAGVDEDGAG